MTHLPRGELGCRLVTLDAEDFEQLNSIGRPGTVAGARHTSPDYGDSADLAGGDDAIAPDGERS